MSECITKERQFFTSYSQILQCYYSNWKYISDNSEGVLSLQFQGVLSKYEQEFGTF